MTDRFMKNTVKKFLAAWPLKAVFLLTPLLMNAAEPTTGDEPKPAIELAVPFTDNAILQRGKEVPVWGWTQPGAKVTVEFAGQRKTGKAGKDGKWMMRLDAINDAKVASELKVIGSNTVTVRDGTKYQATNCTLV